MILHVDMDAFYASVEEQDNPALIGQPVVVGGTAAGRGVVAAANYEARKFGVHSAMAAARAVKLCPQAIVIRPRMDRYAEVSRQIRAIFEQFTPLIEPLSLDEAFLDVSGSERLFGPSPEIGRQIKERIKAELNLIASVGVAPNKFLAKIASDLHKPDGLVVVESGQEQAFLDALPVGRIWGVGKVTGQTFERLGIRTIGQLRQLSRESLADMFGSSGEHYWNLAQGRDERKVIPDREAKSISHETTFAEDIADPEELHAWLVELAEQVARRLRRQELKGRTVNLKIRFSDFKTITRAASVGAPSNVSKELVEIGLQLLGKLPYHHLPIRLLGFGVSNLDASTLRQGQLFEAEDHERQRALDRVADAVAGKFGKTALRRGGGAEQRAPRPDVSDH
jgi:DNA polymerase-4